MAGARGLVNKKRLAALHDMPCCVCHKFGMVQTSPTTAHHVICGRFSQKKASDDETIPLCDDHHQGMWGNDPAKLAIHKGKESWVREYGEDTEYLEWTDEQLA